MKRLIVVILVLMFVSIVSQFQIDGGVAGPVTVGYALNEIEKKANSILENAEFRLNSVVNNGTSSILNITGSFRDKYSEMLDMSVDALDGKMKEAFDSIQSASDDIFYKIENTQAGIDTSVDNLASVIGHTWLGDKIPRVTRQLIPFVIKGSGGSIELDISGIFVEHKENYLKVGEKTYDPVEIHEKKIVFRVPSKDFAINSNDEYQQTVELILHKPYWVFFTEKFTKKFLVRALPQQIGKFTVEYNEKTTSRETKNKSGGLSCQCKGKWTEHTNCGNSTQISPSEDWKINVDSITAGASVTGGDCKQCSGSITQRGPYSFAVNVNAQSRAKKGKLCGCTTSYSWTEYRDTPKEGVGKRENLTLEYGKDVGIKLPANTTTLVNVKLTFYDGKEVIFTRTGTQNGVRIEFDNATKFMKVAAVF